MLARTRVPQIFYEGGDPGMGEPLLRAVWTPQHTLEAYKAGVRLWEKGSSPTSALLRAGDRIEVRPHTG